MTQTTNNWPDPKQEYVPLFPDRDGAHAIEVAGLEITDIVYYWHQNGGGWTEYNHQGSEDFLTDDDMQGWIYKGPILTPTQINEMLAAERERCAIVCENQKPSEDNASRSICLNSRWHTASQCAANIRNLGAAP